MTDGVFKAPKAIGSSFLVKNEDENECYSPPSPKKRRTAEDFITFCNFILEYENYDAQKQEELRTKNSGSPLDSAGSGTESHQSESTASSITSIEDRKPPDESTENQLLDYNRLDDDSWDLVTCYCLKPFAGRPMIECSDCLTWIHLSCAKIRKSNIPKDFICQRCRDAKQTTRRSQRVRNEKRRISA